MVAHTGVAATLLVNGTTVHSRFGLPLNIDDRANSAIDMDSTRGKCCCIVFKRYIMKIQSKIQSNRKNHDIFSAKQLRNLRVIAWDEATMSSWQMFKIVDELLRKVKGMHRDILSKKPFGGVVIICGGDWKQLLPVAVKGGPLEARTLSLKHSRDYWDLFQAITLRKNIRAAKDPQFTQFTEAIGRGRNLVPEVDNLHISRSTNTSYLNITKSSFQISS